MSTNPEARAWIEVRADALRENYADIRRTAGPSAGVLPMVKGDAYGLGVAEVVRVLEPESPWGYGVATVAEGLHIRSLGIDRPILVCSPAPPQDVRPALLGRLQLSISSLEALRLTSEAARDLDVTAQAQLDVDTGMGRSGFDAHTVEEWWPVVSEHSAGIAWTGCYTHLHSADEGSASIVEQRERLARVLGILGDRVGAGFVHTLNSAGVFRAPEGDHALVRPGIFLYGGEVGEGQPVPKPVVSLRARVVHTRAAAPGSTLGYGVTYRAEGPERWATLAIGYGDGLPRILGNRGSALMHGKIVPIIGRISMDVTVVDITGVAEVELGDVATLIGSDGDQTISLDEVASCAGTISYEILTGCTQRLPRVWMDGPEQGSRSDG